MKKFNIRGMIDGLRQSVGSSSPKSEAEIEENLRSEHLQVCKTVRHGFPYQPTSVAFDPVQHILAVGTKSGSLRIFGQPGVDLHCCHDAEVAVLQILFLVNEGALVTCCSDDSLHLWNFRQKRPDIVHTLKFQRERVTHCHLSFQSKWLYVGTERGNVTIVNIESFSLSGYVINWNKAIELSRKTHPGPVVHLSDNPLDPSKLLIGFESGAIVLWDLKSKSAEYRYSAPEALRSISWHHEGKQFMGSHTDGSLTTWNIRSPQKPAIVITPHAKLGKDGKPDPCKPITKVEWKSVRNGEPLVIFSGGMSYDRAGRTPCITVMTGKTTTVLEMEYNVVDFVVLSETPWQNDFQDPYAIVVLLQNDLVVIDLTTPGYPCFENPYPMDIHESPVTACQYFADCPTDLIPAFYSVGSKQKRVGFSEKRWPIKGGHWGTTTCSYPEIIITGHADGSLKFWDASAVTLQVLYKLKTAKIFEKPKTKTLDGQEDDPFAIYLIYLCQESRLMCLAGATHVMMFKFTRQEATLEVPFLEVSIVYEVFDDLDSPELDYPKPSLSVVAQHQQSGSMGSYSSNTSDGNKPEQTTALKVRQGARKWGTGYQPDLVALLTWMDSEHPGNITSVSLNSSYGLMAFGNESGLAIVDIIQKTCLLNLGTPDLYGSMDPYQRAPRSPKGKRYQPLEGSNPALYNMNDDGARSPTSDQSTSPSSSLPVPPPRKSKQSQQVNRYAIKESAKNATNDKPKIEQDQEQLSPVNAAMPSASAQEIPQVQLVPSTPPDDKSQTGEIHRKKSLKKSTSLPSYKDGKLKEMPTVSSTSQSEEIICNTEGTQEDAINSGTESDNNIKIGTGDSDSETKKIKENQYRKISMRGFTKKFKGKHRKLKHVDTSRYYTDHENSLNPTSPISPASRMPRLSAPDILIHSAVNTDESELGEATPAEEKEMEESECPPCAGKENTGFLKKMSVKVKQMMHIVHDRDSDEEEEEEARSLHSRLNSRIKVADLTDDNSKTSKVVIHKINGVCMSPTSFRPRRTYAELKRSRSQGTQRTKLQKAQSIASTEEANIGGDKNDGSSFSRSRSSSMSSLENVSKEAIQCLVFADSYTRKFDTFTCPCLWVGTSLGSVLVIVMNLPSPGEQRQTQPVIVSPSGTIFRLKGAILAMSFLDCNGQLIPAVSSGAWKDISKDSKDEKNSKQASRGSSNTAQKPKISPSSSTEIADKQYAIICSEKQARVVSLPSQTCPYKIRITESSFVIKADVVTLRGDSVCLACYVANGHIMVYSLPSLKLLLDIDFLPLTDLRVARTFSFSNHGHALYMCSPTELQKITYSAEICDNLSEMLGELFLPCDAPEAPKQGFFKNLFSGGPSTLDREELFGEASGKGPRGLATRLPGSGGMQQLQAQAASTVGGEVSRARLLLNERGEKLSGLADRTEEMVLQAESFQSAAHQLMLKYKDKKWYQF